MAAFLRHFATRGLIVRKLANCGALSAGVNVAGARCLFTDGFLQIPKFLDVRKSVEDQFGHMREKFFERMQGYIDDNTGDKMVFSEDLKNVTYMASTSDADLELLRKMIKRYNAQNKEMRFGAFVFGPVVCRLLHHYQKPDLALEMFYDEECKGFFDQLASYMIVMDMLMKANRYEDVLKLWQHFNDNGNFEQRFPRDIVLLVLAACYKLNSPQSFKVASDIVKGARAAGSPISRRAVLFYSTLCLKQKDANNALESLSVTFVNLGPPRGGKGAGRFGGPQELPPGDTRHVPIIGKINLATLSLAMMGRADDALIHLRSAVQEDRPFKTGYVLQETLDALGAEIKKSNQKELIAEFDATAKSIKESDLLIPNRTLDSILDEPIEGFTRTAPNNFNRLRGVGPPEQRQPYRDNYRDKRDARDQYRQGGYQDRRRFVAGQGRQGLTDRDE